MKNRNKIIVGVFILVLAIVMAVAFNDGKADGENVTESVENRE